MAAIEKALDTETWLKVEAASWVRTTGLFMLFMTVAILPIRMYPFYWATRLRLTSLLDLGIVGLLTLFAAVAAAVLLSQSRMAQAEKDADAVEIERGALQLQSISIPFGEVARIVTGSHPMWPLITRVVVETKAGKKTVFAWTGNKNEAAAIAARLRSIVGLEAPQAAE